MSYLSRVGIKCEEKAFELLKDAYKKVSLVPDKVLKEEEYYILYWDWTNWSSPYECVAPIVRVLDTLDEKQKEADSEGMVGYGYKFIRLGEEICDIEERDNGSEIEFITSRRIVLPEIEEIVA